MIKKLSLAPESVIERYLNIKVGPFVTRAPYYMNILSKRFAKPVWIGKGTPDEIEKEASLIYRSYKPYFEKSISQGYNLLLNAGLGIDCSGLVCRVLDAHLRETKGIGISKVIKYKNILRQLFFYLRPFSTVSANVLTNEINSVPVDLDQAKPGDLIRFSAIHVAIIEKVEYRKNRVVSITYVESGIRPNYGVQRVETKARDYQLRRLRACL